MTTPAEPHASFAGRIVRGALIVLPVGTVILGILSFFIYFTKEQERQQRSIRYAAGLRKELNADDLAQRERVLNEQLALSAAEQARGLAIYIASSLGPENMGYGVRQAVDPAEPTGPTVALDVEVTGTKRTNDIVLVLGSLLPLQSGPPAPYAKPMSIFLSLANARTGRPLLRTVRFGAVRDAAALEVFFNESVGVRERIQHIVLIGPMASVSDEEILRRLHLEGRGVQVLRPDLSGDALQAAQALDKQLDGLADRL